MPRLRTNTPHLVTSLPLRSCKKLRPAEDRPRAGFSQLSTYSRSGTSGGVWAGIDRLATNGIDLTKGDIEVSPIAHYHMGGVRVDTHMETSVPVYSRLVRRWAVANGANRLSGNAIPEAFVFGDGRDGLPRSWREKKPVGPTRPPPPWKKYRQAEMSPRRGRGGLGRYACRTQELMWRDVGLLRTQEQLDTALARVQEMRREIGEHPASDHRYALSMQDWFDMRNSLLVAET